MNSAILLVGPTGCGKTPLGQALEGRGLWGRECRHFDFGAQLRGAVEDGPAHNILTDTEVAFVREILRTGALLEDEHFHIAEKLLRAFLVDRSAPGGASPLVVLNGLPRHVAQARRIDSLVHVELVVQLCCPAETVMRRIRTNAGGDRLARVDDDRRLVRDKLDIFAARTEPLVAHYRRGGVRVEALEITAPTTGRAAWTLLSAKSPQNAAAPRSREG